jgi:hypothetical protein
MCYKKIVVILLIHPSRTFFIFAFADIDEVPGLSSSDSDDEEYAYAGVFVEHFGEHK